MVTVEELRAKQFIGGTEVDSPTRIDPLKSGSALLGTPVAPKVTATTQQPVVTRTPGTVEQQPASYDFSDLQSFSPEQLQDFVDQQQIRAMNGQRLTEEDQARLMKASRLMSQSMLPQTVTPTADQQRLDRAQQIRRDTERRLTQERVKSNREYSQLEGTQFAQREAELQDQANRLKDASQQALSFSGFGRSTYAADQATKIQSQTNQILSALAAERDLRIRAEEARARGADEEVLARMDEAIMNLQQQSFEQQLAIAEQLNEFNMQNTQNYQEKIDNILNLAQQYVDVEDLTEDEIALADAYAGLLIDVDGNINTQLLEKLPPKLVGSALKSAAELRGAMLKKEEGIDQSKSQRKEGKDGLFYRTNPETGELETSVTRPAEGVSDTGYATTGTVPGVGTGNVTAYGTEANPYGLDVDGKIGDPINASFNGEVVEVGNDPDGFGNYMIVKDGQGNFVRYAHLDQAGLQEGDKVYKGQMIATIGNTGYVIPMNGGDGSHVDITLIGADGQTKSAEQVEQFLNTGSMDAIEAKLSPIAQSVIDGVISEDKIKDNVKDKSEVPKILAEVQAYRRANTDNSSIDLQTKQMIDTAKFLRDEGGTRIWEALFKGIPFTKSSSDFSKFKFLRDTLTLTNLVDLKAQGATFGALSNEELRMLERSASRLNNKLPEKERKKELDFIINKLTEGDERMQKYANESPVLGEDDDPLGLL